MKPLAIDLFCGLGGWADGLLAEGWYVIGFDIERHDYGTGGYPAELVLQDVLTIHGSQFRNSDLIVASPPCQAYSYRAMPWKRAKALPPPDNTLFDSCFRIQREACEAAGRYIPMVVENVRGAQKWVGRAKWNQGSRYLWGDIPALMPVQRGSNVCSVMNSIAESTGNMRSNASALQSKNGKLILTALEDQGDFKQPGIGGKRKNGKGDAWFQDGVSTFGSKSPERKAASAMISRIPFPLAQHIARVYKPSMVA